MNGKPGQVRARTATSEENQEMIEDLICSQEENPCHQER